MVKEARKAEKEAQHKQEVRRWHKVAMRWADEKAEKEESRQR